MNNLNVRRIKTIKFSSMLDKLVSIAEYSIFIDGNNKYATLVIYNSSDRVVKNFEMKFDFYDDNKARVGSKTVSINNLNLRPRLYLKLNVKIIMPFEAVGFNYSTLSINSGIDSSSLVHNKKSNDFKGIKTNSNQIYMKNMDVSNSKIENVERKTRLKTKWIYLIPIICIAAVGLTSIYYDIYASSLVSSSTRPKGSGDMVVAEKNDFSYEVDSDYIKLNKFVSKKKMIYIDPSVFTKYTGQTILLGENCFRETEIRKVIVYGPCEIGPACFAKSYDFEYFACTNYTSKDINYEGQLKLISANSFFGCSSLTTFAYQSSAVTRIHAGAFYYCTELENFVLPEVTSIDTKAFSNCKKLGKQIIFPSSLQRIGEAAYKDSSIVDVTFSNPYTEKASDSFNSGVKFYGSNKYDEDGKEV